LSDEESAHVGEELMAVGKILRPHGIRGALVVEPLTDWPDRFAPGSRLLLEKAPSERVEVTVVSGASHKGRLLVTLEGTEDRDGAEALKGMYLMIRGCDASPLGEGEYWAHELVGLQVVSEDGTVLGEVSEVFCRDAQDLLVARNTLGAEFSIPFVKEFIKRVDMRGKVVMVTLPEGMEP